MTVRLVAAFILGGLCLGVPIGVYFVSICTSRVEVVLDECDTDIDDLVSVCKERIETARASSQRLSCRLLETERLLLPLYPDWRGFFAERDRQRIDAEYGCDGPDMAPSEWTMEELASNKELGAR